VYCSRSFSFVFRLYSSSYSSLPEMPRVALYIYSVVSFLYSSLRARCGRGWPLPHVPQKVPGPSGRLAAAVVLGQHLRVRWSRVPFLGPRSSLLLLVEGWHRRLGSCSGVHVAHPRFCCSCWCFAFSASSSCPSLVPTGSSPSLRPGGVPRPCTVCSFL
jgi:hypothetical protein